MTTHLLGAKTMCNKQGLSLTLMLDLIIVLHCVVVIGWVGVHVGPPSDANRAPFYIVICNTAFWPLWTPVLCANVSAAQLHMAVQRFVYLVVPSEEKPKSTVHGSFRKKRKKTQLQKPKKRLWNMSDWRHWRGCSRWSTWWHNHLQQCDDHGSANFLLHILRSLQQQGLRSWNVILKFTTQSYLKLWS